jgi:hypothetical protein
VKTNIAATRKDFQMAPNDARTMENDEQNPGLTPVDDAAAKINRAGRKHEPDRTTGRLPERAEKPRRQEKKPRNSRSR